MKKNLAADMTAESEEEIIKKKLDRDRVIIRTSMIGIAANVALAAFKAIVGLASNSVAIVMDAVNNFSDAASSCITIAGTKLAAREPDKKHPFGYGRIEYLSSMIVAALVLYAGITSLVESIKNILDPTVPEYTVTGLLIIAVAVIVKIFLSIYFLRKLHIYVTITIHQVFFPLINLCLCKYLAVIYIYIIIVNKISFHAHTYTFSKYLFQKCLYTLLSTRGSNLNIAG